MIYDGGVDPPTDEQESVCPDALSLPRWYVFNVHMYHFESCVTDSPLLILFAFLLVPLLGACRHKTPLLTLAECVDVLVDLCHNDSLH